jgi:hypothetical protein
MEMLLNMFATVVLLSTATLASAPAIAQNSWLQRASVVTVGPDGDVVLFMKLQDNVLIKTCEAYSIIEKNENCSPKAGTSVAQVPAIQLKENLLGYLEELYSSDTYEREIAPDLDSRLLSRETAVKRIRDFIQFYCGIVDLNSDCALKNADVKSLSKTTEELKWLKGYEPRIRFEKKIIEKMVDEIIGVDAITTYRASDKQTNLFYRLLKGYTLRQNLPNANNDPVNPVPPPTPIFK